MAANLTKPKGPRSDKLMRDALAVELAREITVKDGIGRKHAVRKLRLVAAALVREAIAGDVPAIRECFDRMDGKLASVLAMRPAGEGEGPNSLGGITLADLVTTSYEVGRRAGQLESPIKTIEHAKTNGSER